MKPQYLTPTAIILGAVIVAAAILCVFRWEAFRVGPQPFAVVRLDRWSGKLTGCDQTDAVKVYGDQMQKLLAAGFSLTDIFADACFH
jgi:hypothetical protein